MALLSVPEMPRPAKQALRPLTMVSAAALCGALAFHWLMLVPAEQRLAGARAAYEGARSQAVALKAERKKQEHVRELERGLDLVWAKLPASREFNSLAIAISELARTVGVSVPGMTHQHKRGEDGLPGKASLAFQATGKYEDIYTFIHRLETMERYLVIEQLDASRARDREARREGAVQFNVQVVTFLKRGDEAGPERIS